MGPDTHVWRKLPWWRHLEGEAAVVEGDKAAVEWDKAAEELSHRDTEENAKFITCHMPILDLQNPAKRCNVVTSGGPTDYK
jgi:hypothetical protein